MVIKEDSFRHKPVSDVTVSGDAGDGTVAVLEWRAWNNFLLPHVLGDSALRIETDPFREFPSDQFEMLCRSVSIVCFQINLTVRHQLQLRIRDLTRRFVDRGVYVVNGLVQDIRKSTLQTHLNAIGLLSAKADQSGPPDEILFVKTNLNHGGELERWLPAEIRASTGCENLVSPDIGAYGYKLAERRNLPETIWTDPAIAVEKYISNADNSFYRAYFSGKEIIIVRAFAPGVIKKLSNDPRDTNFVSELDFLKDGSDELPISSTLKRDVAVFVENTPVDFGCIDIVHDGHDHHYIVDLNLTPYAGKNSPDYELSEILKAGITYPSQRKPAVSIHTPLA